MGPAKIGQVRPAASASRAAPCVTRDAQLPILRGMRLIALDPALRNSGYALLEGDSGRVRVLDFGVIRNDASLCMSLCLVAIHREIGALIERYRPELCAVESVIFVQNSKTAVTLGAARGSALLAVAQRGLLIYEYPPKRVKQAVVGRGFPRPALFGAGQPERGEVGREDVTDPGADDQGHQRRGRRCLS